MSKQNENFEIALDAEQGEWAVREAVASVGWGIKDVGPGRLVPRIGVGISRNPSSIEVTWRSEGDKTMVELRGKITGMGPIQKRHLGAEMNRLRNAIEVAAHRAAAAS